MPRPKNSRGRFNSTKFSEFYPGTASSPLNEEQSLNKEELEEYLKSEAQKIADEYNANFLEHYKEAFVELKKTIQNNFTPEELDIPVTPEILEVVRTMFKKSLGGVNETEKKTTFTKADHGDNVSDSEDQTENKNTSREDVFKKPAGAAKKKRQQSKNISKELYKTPKRIGYKRGYNIAEVTPGPDINRPISVLRRPVPGEMAVSMNGSPLVTSCDNISVPQMSIPLSNGRIVTYLANELSDPEQSICDEIDPETQERLNVFYKLLEKKIKKKK